MRLSSSFSGKSNGELAPLALALEYRVLACGVLLERGVLDGLVGAIMLDFDDLGVTESMLSNPSCGCFWLLDCGRVLGISSEKGLGGVRWKFLNAWLSGVVVVEGSCRSSQFNHKG